MIRILSAMIAVAAMSFLPAMSMGRNPDVALAHHGLSGDSTQTAPGQSPQDISGRDKEQNDSLWWWNQLRSGKLDLKNPNVVYPKFLKFCVNVYNWGNQAFNGTDSSYVVPTGKRWKVMLRNDNWLDSYAMRLNKINVHMLSDVVCNLGLYVSYMAITVGYQLDMTNVIGNKPINHNKFEFNFSCARFSIDAYYNRNTGGTYLRHLGDYRNGRFFKYHLEDLTMRNWGIDAFYFVNNMKYSQGAAYNFSRIQKKSAGSIILGFTGSNNRIEFDFANLPDKMVQALQGRNFSYRFHYNSYGLIIGYGYNAVMGKHWLFNICATPSIGWKYCFPDCVGGKRNLFSADIKGRFSFTYNNGDFFASAIGRMDGHWYKSSHYSFFNSIENLLVTLGIRF